MFGKHVLDVFGGGDFLTKATNRLGLCGHVPETKCGPKYDVAQALLFSPRIRQDVSAGKCVAGMISHPRQHTSCSSKIIFRQCCHRKLASSGSQTLDSGNTHVIHGSGTRRRSRSSCGTASHGLGPGRLLCFSISHAQKANFVSGR